MCKYSCGFYPLQIRKGILQIELQQVSKDGNTSRARREIFRPVGLKEKEEEQSNQQEQSDRGEHDEAGQHTLCSPTASALIQYMPNTQPLPRHVIQSKMLNMSRLDALHRFHGQTRVN